MNTVDTTAMMRDQLYAMCEELSAARAATDTALREQAATYNEIIGKLLGLIAQMSGRP